MSRKKSTRKEPGIVTKLRSVVPRPILSSEMASTAPGACSTPLFEGKDLVFRCETGAERLLAWCSSGKPCASRREKATAKPKKTTKSRAAKIISLPLRFSYIDPILASPGRAGLQYSHQQSEVAAHAEVLEPRMIP